MGASGPRGIGEHYRRFAARRAASAGADCVTPGKTLTLDAGRATLSGSARVRNFGYTDTAIPGAFVPAEALDLPGLAQARQMTVTWGERRSTLPAPSPEKLADFTRRCGDGLQQGAATPAG